MPCVLINLAIQPNIVSISVQRSRRLPLPGPVVKFVCRFRSIPISGLALNHIVCTDIMLVCAKSIRRGSTLGICANNRHANVRVWQEHIGFVDDFCGRNGRLQVDDRLPSRQGFGVGAYDVGEDRPFAIPTDRGYFELVGRAPMVTCGMAASRRATSSCPWNTTMAFASPIRLHSNFTDE